MFQGQRLVAKVELRQGSVVEWGQSRRSGEKVLARNVRTEVREEWPRGKQEQSIDLRVLKGESTSKGREQVRRLLNGVGFRTYY